MSRQFLRNLKESYLRIHQASYALRVVRRRGGYAGIIYRRQLNKKGKERLTRVAAISPIAFSAGATLLRAAVRASEDPDAKLSLGPFHPLDTDWGPRVACYALVAKGLYNPDRLHRAATHLYHADPTEAAWWFGLLSNHESSRAVRALRILTEAVE